MVYLRANVANLAELRDQRQRFSTRAATLEGKRIARELQLRISLKVLTLETRREIIP